MHLRVVCVSVYAYNDENTTMSTVYCVGISYNMCIGTLKCHLPSPTTRRRWSINPRECGAYYILSYIVTQCIRAGWRRRSPSIYYYYYCLLRALFPSSSNVPKSRKTTIRRHDPNDIFCTLKNFPLITHVVAVLLQYASKVQLRQCRTILVAVD